MKKILLGLILIAMLLPSGCNQAHREKQVYGYDDYAMADSIQFSRTTANSNWEGIGFSDGDAGIGQTPTAFRDMSAMYGKMSLEPEYEASIVVDEFIEQGGDSLSAGSPNEVERKLVKRASVRIRVDNLETADTALADLLKEYEGYSASTSVDDATHSYSLRVPSQYYEIFLSGLSGLGKVLRRNETTDDVTLRYYDLEGRLATKKNC